MCASGSSLGRLRRTSSPATPLTSVTSLVIVGTLTATASVRDPPDVAEYGKLFAELARLAGYDAARGELERIADAYRASEK